MGDAVQNAPVIGPATTSPLIGQDQAIGQFLQAWQSGKHHHAWMITGPQGVGKSTFAYHIARYLMCRETAPDLTDNGMGLFGNVDTAPPDSAPDNALDRAESTPPSQADSPNSHLQKWHDEFHQAKLDHPQAKMMAAGNHSDFRLITPLAGKQQIGIEQIRTLIQFTSLTPAMGDWRVIIIDALDDLTLSAANAILKILEEPPPQCLFLLVCHTPGQILPTIRSRCRLLRLGPLSPQAINHAFDLFVKDYPAFSDLSADELGQIAHFAEGSLGMAVDLAQTNGIGLYSQLLRLVEASLKPHKPADLTGDIYGLAGVLGKADNKRGFAICFRLVSGFLARLAKASARQTSSQAVVAEEQPLIDIINKAQIHCLKIEDKRQEIQAIVSQSGPPTYLDGTALTLSAIEKLISLFQVK